MMIEKFNEVKKPAVAVVRDPVPASLDALKCQLCLKAMEPPFCGLPFPCVVWCPSCERANVICYDRAGTLTIGKAL